MFGVKPELVRCLIKNESIGKNTVAMLKAKERVEVDRRDAIRAIV